MSTWYNFGPVLSQPAIMVPTESPIPLYPYRMFASSLDAAATEMRSFSFSSCSLRIDRQLQTVRGDAGEELTRRR